MFYALLLSNKNISIIIRVFLAVSPLQFGDVKKTNKQTNKQTNKTEQNKTKQNKTKQNKQTNK